MKKTLLLTFGLVFTLILTGCTQSSDSIKETETTTKSTNSYVGLTVSEAQALATKNNTPFRIVAQDGESFAVTMDFIEGRINATVENNLVVDYNVEGNFEKAYNQDSWKDLISENCQSFSDGCNNCKRMPDGGAACTRKACSNYEKPQCLDAKE